MTNDAGNPDSSSIPEAPQPLAPPPLAPPPLPRVDALGEPEPIPVAALAYSTPAYGFGRPPILTGVGVFSIIVATISGLASLIQGCQSVVAMSIAQSAKTASRSGGAVLPPPTVTIQSGPAPALQVPPPTLAPVVTRANGLDEADRSTAITALATLRPLSAPRRTELELFLAEDGQQVFPTGGRALTAAQVRANVSRSNVISGATQYVTVWGTLIVYDNRVEFEPSGASQPLVTSTSPMVTGQVGMSPFTPLTQAQVQQAITAVQTDASMTLNPAQVAALSAQLQNPQQTFVPSTSMPVTTANDMGNGRVWIMFGGGSCIEIDANGVVTTSTFLASTPFGSASVNATMFGCVLVEAMISVGLAGLLLVAAIFLFRDSNWARRLHLTFAGLKIALVVVGWLAMMRLMGRLFSTAASKGAVPLAGIFTFASVFCVIALIYPIALFFIFRLRGVRDYYNSVR